MKPADHQQVAEIFWETSSRKDFASEEERLQFRHQYLDVYFSQLGFVAQEGDDILGYIVAQLDTLATESTWAPHLALFRSEYSDYPAHLHINCRSTAQGKGIGGQLLTALEQQLVEYGAKGLHLITAAKARNVSFYKKYKYLEVALEQWKGTELVLLGKVLQAR